LAFVANHSWTDTQNYKQNYFNLESEKILPCSVSWCFMLSTRFGILLYGIKFNNMSLKKFHVILKNDLSKKYFFIKQYDIIIEICEGSSEKSPFRYLLYTDRYERFYCFFHKWFGNTCNTHWSEYSIHITSK